MKEDQYIASLFESAKKETPKLSFEEVAEKFNATVPPATPIEILKEIISQISLNNLTMITFGSLAISTILLVGVFNNNNQTTVDTTGDTFLNSVEEVSGLEENYIDNQLISQEENTNEQVEKEQASTEKDKGIPESRTIKNEFSLQKTPLNQVEFSLKDYLSESMLSFLQRESITDSLPGGNLMETTGLGISSNPFENYGEAVEKLDASDFYETIVNKEKNANWPKQSKNFSKEWNVEANDWTNVISEWGKIEVSSWDQNKVKIEAIATVSAKQEKKIEEVLKHINIRFDQKKGGVYAETHISKKKAIKWHHRKNWKVSIDYKVYLPKNGNLKVVHRHGDVIVEEIGGAGSFDLYFAKMDAKKIGDNSKLVLRSGTATIEKSGDLHTQLSFSKCFLGDVGNLTLENRNATLEAKTAQKVFGNSYYGTHKFESTKDFTIDSKGGIIEIGKVEKLDLSHSNGTVTIDYAKDVKAILSFSKLYGKEYGNLDLDMKNSTLEVPKAKDIVCQSTYGKFKFETVGNYQNDGVGDQIELVSAKEMRLNLSNGRIHMKEGGDFKGSLSHAKLFAESLGKVDLTQKNSVFDVDRVKDFKSNSQYGHLILDEVQVFEHEGVGTKVEIKKAKEILASGNATKITAEEIDDKLDLDLTYGGLEGTLKNSQPEINLVGKNASFRLKLPKDSQFQFDFSSNSKNYDFPKGIEKNYFVEQVGKHEVKGFLGNKESKNLIKARLNFGELKLDLK